MITLYTFGPAFGLPDPSPFVVKAEMLLKLAGQPYRTDTHGFKKAPKGKLPYIDDEGEVVADSTLIRLHLERKYGFDFDRGLSAEQRGIAWAVEKLLEDNLYWAIVHARWVDDANFAKGPSRYFSEVPWPMRSFVTNMVRRRAVNQLYSQGTGRHTRAEIELLAARGIDAVAAVLGGKTCLMGDQPCGADATTFAFVQSALCPLFETPLRMAVEKHENLVAYVQRMQKQYYA